MRCAKAILGLATLGLATPILDGQSPRILFRDEDPIIGVGGVDRVDYIAVGDSGSWLSLVESDVADNNVDRCLLRSGFLTLREGMNLPLPTGAVLDDWGSISLASNGDLGQVLRIRISGGSASDALYWNLSPLGIKGEVLNIPPFPPNTTFDGARVVRVTADRTVVALIKVRNTRTVDALMRYRMDAQGNVLQREVLATKDDFNPVLETAIDTLGTDSVPEHSLAMNRRGDFALPVQGIGRKVIMKNMDTIVAQELLPSPVPGRTWGMNAFVLAKVAINDLGDVVYSGALTPIGGTGDPTNLLIAKNDTKFAQSGDVIPALSPSPLGKQAPLLAVTNRGDVFWRASPTSGTAGGAAFMINHTPLIQEAVTVVDGNLVLTIPGGDDCFAVSPEGRFLLARATLQSVGDAVLYVDFGLISELPGCLGLNQGTLRHLSGVARIGQQIQVGMDDGPAPGALPLFFFSRRPSLTAEGCGLPSQVGELMLAAPYSNLFVLPAWDGVNPSVFTINVPNNMALVDATFYAQGLFGDPDQPTSFRLTNGLKFEIGPP